MDSYQTENLIYSLLRLTVFPSLQQRSFNRVDQIFTWFSLDIGQTLILHHHSALCCMLFLQPSNMNFRIFVEKTISVLQYNFLRTVDIEVQNSAKLKIQPYNSAIFVSGIFKQPTSHCIRSFVSERCTLTQAYG